MEKDFWKPLSSLSFYDAIKQQAANSQFIISINQNVIGKINDYIENLDSRHTSFLKNYQRGLMCYCSSLAGEKE